MKTFITWLACLLLFASAGSADTVRIAPIGVQIEAPEDWFLLNNKGFLEGFEKVAQGDETFDKHLLRMSIYGPFRATKFPKAYGARNPTIEIKVHGYSEMPGDKAPVSLLRRIVEKARKDADFGAIKTLSHPAKTELAGHAAAKTVVRVKAKDRAFDGKIRDLTVELWAVPLTHYFLFVFTMRESEQDAETLAEIEAAMASLKIAGE